MRRSTSESVQRLFRRIQQQQIATYLRKQAIVVAQVTVANADQSYDVRMPETGVIVPGLWRRSVDITRLAPGDPVAVRMTGHSPELL